MAQPARSRRARLTRQQQHTLNTWRWSARKLNHVLQPHHLLELTAQHAVLAVLRAIDDPLVLLDRHARSHAELSLVVSLVANEQQAYEILDCAFLLRWDELLAEGHGPEELTPVRPSKEVIAIAA